MRQQTEFDLRVIRYYKLPAFLRNECRADLTAQLGTDRNVLQIRVRRRKPAGRGTSLIEGRVDAPVYLTGSVQAAHRYTCPSVSPVAGIPAPAAQSDIRPRVPRGYPPLSKSIYLCRISPGGKLQVFVKDLRQLLRRIDVERTAGMPVYFFGKPAAISDLKPLREDLKLRRIHANAGLLHAVSTGTSGRSMFS